MAKHEALFSKHVNGSLDEPTLVLKTHLLLEELLRDFCLQSVPYPKHLRQARLSFNQTAQLARSLCILSDTAFDWIWSVVSHLNKMRNLMAHELEPDQAKFEECRQKIIAAALSFSRPSETEVLVNLNELGGCLGYTLGALSTILEVGMAMETDELNASGEQPRATDQTNNTDETTHAASC